MTARGAWVIALIAAASVACDTPAAPERRPQGLQAGEETPRGPVTLPNAAPPSEPTPTPSSLPSPFLAKAPNPGALAVPDPAAPEAEPATAEARDAAPPRDLSGELRTLLGQPASCLDLAAVEASGGRVVVSAHANVVPSGRITRATVTVPGQPSTAVRCLEQRLSSASLKGPIAGAPLQVATSIPVEIVSAPPR